MISITSNSDFITLKKLMETLKSDLDSLKTSYSQAINDINGSAGNIDFSSWEDEIKNELNSYLTDDFKSSCEKISNDLESGNYVSLYNAVTNLITELDFCIDCKKRIENKKIELSNTDQQVQEPVNPWVPSDETGPKYVDNPTYTALKNELLDLKEELDGYIMNCKNYLTTIASITFTGTFDKVNVNTNTPSSTSPSSVYNQIPDNLSEDYHPDIYIDSAHTIDLPGLWILNENYSETSEPLHFVYNEQDKCYYEVTQNLVGGERQYIGDSYKEESPGDYGYVGINFDTLMNSKIKNR